MCLCTLSSCLRHNTFDNHIVYSFLAASIVVTLTFHFVKLCMFFTDVLWCLISNLFSCVPLNIQHLKFDVCLIYFIFFIAKNYFVSFLCIVMEFVDDIVLLYRVVRKMWYPGFNNLGNFGRCTPILTILSLDKKFMPYGSYASHITNIL